MRPSNKSRSRNKSGSSPQRRNIGNIVNRVFESAGPDGKVRGTPQQIIDKYHALARDAQVSGDRVAAENYQQHAEHYTRLLGEAVRQAQDSRAQPDRDDREDREDRDETFAREEAADRGQHRQPQPEPQHRPQQAEPAGLTTLGSDDRDDAGPVDTPEEAARARDGGLDGTPVPQALNGGHRDGDGAAPQGEAAAPKRTRSRRKPKAEAPVAEAGAD